MTVLMPIEGRMLCLSLIHWFSSNPSQASFTEMQEEDLRRQISAGTPRGEGEILLERFGAVAVVPLQCEICVRAT